jgi:hypothetical protein
VRAAGHDAQTGLPETSPRTKPGPSGTDGKASTPQTPIPTQPDRT